MRKIIIALVLTLITITTTLFIGCSPSIESYDVTVTAEEGITIEYKEFGGSGFVYVLTAGTDDVIGYVRIDGGQGDEAITLNKDETPNISFAIKNSYLNSFLKITVNETELVKTIGGSYQIEIADDGKLVTFSGAPTVSGPVTINITGIDISNLIHN